MNIMFQRDGMNVMKTYKAGRQKRQKPRLDRTGEKANGCRKTSGPKGRNKCETLSPGGFVQWPSAPSAGHNFPNADDTPKQSYQ